MENNYLKGEKIKKNAKDKHKTNAKSKIGEIDHEAEAIFEVEDVGHGDEFMAVLPWKGAIKEPKNHPRLNPSPPDVSY